MSGGPEEPGRFGPLHPWLGRLGYRAAYPLLRRFAPRRGVLTPEHPEARARSKALAAKIDRGERAYVVGLGAGGHDAGASLIVIEPGRAVRLLGSHQEERFTGLRHYADYPEQSLEEIRRQVAECRITPDDVDAWVATFDYAELFARAGQILCEELPKSTALIHPAVYEGELSSVWGAFRARDTSSASSAADGRYASSGCLTTGTTRISHGHHRPSPSRASVWSSVSSMPVGTSARSASISQRKASCGLSRPTAPSGTASDISTRS